MRTTGQYEHISDVPGRFKVCARCQKKLSLSHYSRPCAVRCIACIALDVEDRKRGEAWCMRCRTLHPVSAYSPSALEPGARTLWCRKALSESRRACRGDVVEREARREEMRSCDELEQVRRIEERQRARGEAPDEPTGRMAA